MGGPDYAGCRTLSSRAKEAAYVPGQKGLSGCGMTITALPGGNPQNSALALKACSPGKSACPPQTSAAVPDWRSHPRGPRPVFPVGNGAHTSAGVDLQLPVDVGLVDQRVEHVEDTVHVPDLGVGAQEVDLLIRLLGCFAAVLAE